CQLRSQLLEQLIAPAILRPIFQLANTLLKVVPPTHRLGVALIGCGGMKARDFFTEPIPCCDATLGRNFDRRAEEMTSLATIWTKYTADTRAADQPRPQIRDQTPRRPPHGSSAIEAH